LISCAGAEAVSAAAVANAPANVKILLIMQPSLAGTFSAKCGVPFCLRVCRPGSQRTRGNRPPAAASAQNGGSG
jgi:hypothetical protein